MMSNGNSDNDGDTLDGCETEDELPQPAQETALQQSIRKRAERREARGSAQAPGTPRTPLHTLASVRKALDRGTASVRKIKVSSEDDEDREPPPPPAAKASTKDAAAPAFGLRGGGHLPVGSQEELEEALRVQRVRMGGRGKKASTSPRTTSRTNLVFGEATERGRSEHVHAPTQTTPPKLPTPPASTSPRGKAQTSPMPDNGQWEQVMQAMKMMAKRVDSMAGAQDQLVEHIASLDSAFVSLEKKKEGKPTETVDLDACDSTEEPAQVGTPGGVGSGVFSDGEEDDFRKLQEYKAAILRRSLHAPASPIGSLNPPKSVDTRIPPTVYTPLTIPSEDAEEWAERQTSKLRAEYDNAPDDLTRESIMFKMVMLRPQGALAQASGSNRKDAKNHVSTEKLKKSDDFRGAVHKRMLQERMWYETDVREYLTHASPDGGLPLYHAIQKYAAPLALAYSQATTAEERVDIIANLDLISVPKGLDKEMVTRFPAVFARALNRDALQFHAEYLQVTLNSHERGPMATLVAWRFASLCGNGPRNPEDWLNMTNFVEKPSRVLRDADSTTVLLAWREWLNLAKETIALGLTSAARIAPGMKTAFQEFMSFIGPERSHRLRVKGFYAAGLDSRGTTWERLEEVYTVMYSVCGYLDDEPDLRRHLRKSSRANVGKQETPGQGAHAEDHKDKRPPTPPARRRNKESRSSRSRSASSASRSRPSRSASPASGATGKVKLDDKAKVIKDAATAESTDRKRAKSKLRRANAAIKKAAAAAVAAAAQGKKTPPPRSRSPAARPAQSTGDGPPGECFLFKADGKCRFGDRCRFVHAKKGHAARDASRPKSPGRGETNPPSRPCYNCGKTGHMIAECRELKKPGSPCYYFQIRGECRYGDLCKHAHSKAKASAAKTPAAKEGQKPDFP